MGCPHAFTSYWFGSKQYNKVRKLDYPRPFQQSDIDRMAFAKFIPSSQSSRCSDKMAIRLRRAESHSPSCRDGMGRVPQHIRFDVVAVETNRGFLVETDSKLLVEQKAELFDECYMPEQLPRESRHSPRCITNTNSRRWSRRRMFALE